MLMLFTCFATLHLFLWLSNLCIRFHMSFIGYQKKKKKKQLFHLFWVVYD